ncbi:hypothetical protein ACQKII_14430 [Lysinibacillus sp. NPDC048646]
MLKGWKEDDSEKYKDGGTSGYYTKNDAEITLVSLNGSVQMTIFMPDKK